MGVTAIALTYIAIRLLNSTKAQRVPYRGAFAFASSVVIVAGLVSLRGAHSRVPIKNELENI